MITLCNHKPKWTASLSSVPTLILDWFRGNLPVLCHCRVWNMAPRASRDARKHLWRWGKKLQWGESPLLQQPPLGYSLDPLAGDPAFLRAGNALPSCHPDTPELPQQAVFYWFHCRFHCQNSSTRGSSLLGSMCHVHGAKSTPRAECTGAGLGRMKQLHWEGCSSFPCLLKPSSNTAQVQPVTALLWVLSHRNPGNRAGDK